MIKPRAVSGSGQIPDNEFGLDDGGKDLASRRFQHGGFTRNGRRFANAPGGEPEAEDYATLMADCMSFTMRWIWKQRMKNNGTPHPMNWRRLVNRLVAATYAIDPSLAHEPSLAHVAKRLKVSKSWLVELRMQFLDSAKMTTGRAADPKRQAMREARELYMATKATKNPLGQ